MVMSGRGSLFVAVCILIACDSQHQSESVVARDSAGITIVDNRGSGRDTGAPWQIEDTASLRIGAVTSANEAFEFSRIHAVTRLSDGRIVVLAGQASEIRWFDDRGQYLATRGGRGGGPGEFNFAATLIRSPDDAIIVEDRPRVKHVFFSDQAEYVGEETLDADRLGDLGPWAECASRTLPDRSLLMCRPEPGHERLAPDPGPGHLRQFSRYVRLTWNLDTVQVLGLYGGIEQWGISEPSQTRFAVHPFHSRTATAAGGTPMQVAIAINPAYSIEVWDTDGTLHHIVRRLGARRAPTPAESAAAEERLATYAGGDEALANRFVAEIEAPDSIPAVLGLWIDPANYLWVQRTGTIVPRTSIEYDILDDSGTYLGTVELPGNFRPYEIGLDYILGVSIDENDVPFVELYALNRGR